MRFRIACFEEPALIRPILGHIGPHNEVAGLLARVPPVLAGQKANPR